MPSTVTPRSSISSATATAVTTPAHSGSACSGRALPGVRRWTVSGTAQSTAAPPRPASATTAPPRPGPPRRGRARLRHPAEQRERRQESRERQSGRGAADAGRAGETEPDGEGAGQPGEEPRRGGGGGGGDGRGRRDRPGRADHEGPRGGCLHERLRQQPQAEHRVADHRGQPGQLRAPGQRGRRGPRAAEVPVGEDDGDHVRGHDHDDLDVPDHRGRHEPVCHLVVVVERVRQVQRPVRRAHRVAEQRQQELAVDQDVLEVVREQVAVGDRQQRGQQPGEGAQRRHAGRARRRRGPRRTRTRRRRRASQR